MPRYSLRAFSLVEVVMAAGLAALLGLLFLEVLGPALRASGRNAARIGLQESALLAMQRLLKDFQAATPAGIGLLQGSSPQPTVVSVHRVTGAVTTSPASLVFADQLVIYVYQPLDGSITRRSWPEDPANGQSLDGSLLPPTPLLALRPKPSSLAYFASHPGTSDRRLVTQVKSFRCRSAVAAPQISSPLVVELELESELPGQQTYSFSLNQSCSLRLAE